MAHHDLMSIAVEMGNHRLAELHAGAAVSLYPHDHPRLPALAHDFAFSLLRRGHYTAAVALLEQVVPLIARPHEQTLVLASLAWAAAGAGRAKRHAEAQRAAVELVGAFEEYAPGVFLHLGEGWRARGDWDRAERFADAARRAAERHGERHLAREARALQAAARDRASADAPVSGRTRAVLRDLSARLRGWKQAPG